MENERESQASETSAVEKRIALPKLLLASGSLRRAEILRAVGWPFETLAADIDETRAASESASDYVKRLAREKAEAVAKLRVAALTLGADTTVVVDGEVLGKPVDDEDARRMLRRLSGRWHEVLTGVALVRGGETARCLVRHETTRVRFALMTEAEIDDYVATKEPMDKAGAYAIQGRAALFIEEIAGDYWNVVGLPVRLVYEMMFEMRVGSWKAEGGSEE
jgi:septum formation protein